MLSLSEVVTQLLTHLQKEEVGPADRLSKEWFANGGTTEGASELDLKRWQMTQELLDVAWSIPLPVTAALAKGIDANDPAIAVPDLKSFRTKNVEGAATANKVLSTKAPGLYPYITGSLEGAPAKQQPRVTYNAPTSFATERAPYYGFSASERVGSGSRWGIGGTIGVIAIFLVRCAAITSTTSHSYDYNNDYSFNSHDYDLDQKTQDLLKQLEHNPSYDDTTAPTPDYNNYTPPAPTTPPDPPELSSKDPEDLYSDLSVSVGAFYYDDVATEKQQDAVEKFETAMLDRDCKGMRTQMAILEKQPNVKEGDYVGLAKKHVKAMRTRVNLVCPAGGAKKAPAAKAAPPADPAPTDTGL